MIYFISCACSGNQGLNGQLLLNFLVYNAIDTLPELTSNYVKGLILLVNAYTKAPRFTDNSMPNLCISSGWYDFNDVVVCDAEMVVKKDCLQR